MSVRGLGRQLDVVFLTVYTIYKVKNTYTYMDNMQEDRLAQIHKLMEDIRAQVAQLESLVQEYGPIDASKPIKMRAQSYFSETETRRGRVIEGVFDGQNMIGPEEKIYTVPANYASKSKLVAGDIMKLTITDDGSFIYKQIGPVDRLRVKASLVRDAETGAFRALTPQGASYRLLTASVTYYKGEVGDTVVVLIPKEMESRWAAVDNIIHEPLTDTTSEPEDMSENEQEVDFFNPYARTPEDDIVDAVSRDFEQDFGDAVEFSLPKDLDRAA